MRLQGAIFELEGALLDRDGVPLPGLEPFLSLMKVEDVWMYLVTGVPSSQARQALEDAGLKVNKLYEQRADWDQTKGQENAANVLSQFNDEVDVIFCNNDAMAMGALQAIEAAGRKVGEDIYLVGVDALEEAVQAVAAGRMTGTVLNDDVSQAQTAVDAAVRYLKGEANDKNYTIDYVKVTPENAADYIK